MLILTRYVGQSVQIGEDIKTTILSDNNGQIQIEFDAPRDVDIWREEIYEQIQKQE